MTETNLTITAAAAEDVASIALFNIRMAMETEQVRLDPTTVERGVAAVLNNPAKGTYFVARRGTAVVGCLLITHEWSDWRDGDMWWIQSVYVHPDHRSAGVFKRLYAHVEALARGAGVRAIRLYVERHNGRAKAVYEKLGLAMTEYDVMHKSLTDPPGSTVE
jgi:ribosomal protein S18 acetylase RimI-like enzyme